MGIGIGYANEEDGFVCGEAVGRQALGQAGADSPDLVLAFCGGSVPHDTFFEGLRSVVGGSVPIIGGSAIGVITNDRLSYEGHPAAAAVIGSDRFRCRVAAAGSVNRDEQGAGALLAESLGREPEDRFLLFFYDSIKAPAQGSAPPIMNASPPLIAGIESRLAPGVPIIGAGVVGDYSFGPTVQFCGDHVAPHSVVGAMFTAGCSIDSTVMHGCTLKDGVYHTLSKIAGPVIHEIDCRPAARVIDEAYGSGHWRTQVPVKRLSLGVNHGDRYGDFHEDEYVIRLITGVIPETDAIVMFEPDLDEGTEIQFMLRDANKMMESARRCTADLMDRVLSRGRKPVLGLYIDCAGRTAGFSDTLTEEAAQVQAVLNRHAVPLMGFYSGVEVAPLLGRSRGLDWTGVLMVLSED